MAEFVDIDGGYGSDDTLFALFSVGHKHGFVQFVALWNEGDALVFLPAVFEAGFFVAKEGYHQLVSALNGNGEASVKVGHHTLGAAFDMHGCSRNRQPRFIDHHAFQFSCH